MANTVAKYQKYTEYKESGVEWLGEIPSHWFLKKHKYIAEFSKGKNPELLFDNYSDGLYPYLSMDSLRGKTDSKYAEYKKGLVLVQDNQPLIIWDGSNSGEFVLGRKGLLSSTMASACLIYEIQDKYYWYLCVCIEPEMRKHATGMGIPHVNGEELRGIVLPLPELNEQTQIAKFLDHETIKIDHLIEKQHQLIELLKEKRQAVISHAVTKGLDPNVQMKDSGVEWLGEVPEHWILSNLKYFASIQGGYAFNSDLFVEEGTQVLRIGNVYQNTLSLDRQPIYISNELVKNFKDFIVSKNDVLMSLTGTLGKRDYGFAIKVKTDEKYLLNQRVAKISPNPSKIDTDFMVYVLWSESYLTQLYSLPSGTKQANLSNSDVLGIQIVVPPSLDEQKDIAKYLKNKLLKFDDMILKAESAISLMQERRTALISAAVTGKIDVRNWQAPSVTEADTELSA